MFFTVFGSAFLTVLSRITSYDFNRYRTTPRETLFPFCSLNLSSWLLNCAKSFLPFLFLFSFILFTFPFSVFLFPIFIYTSLLSFLLLFFNLTFMLMTSASTKNLHVDHQFHAYPDSYYDWESIEFALSLELLHFTALSGRTLDFLFCFSLSILFLLDLLLSLIFTLALLLSILILQSNFYSYYA